MEQEERHEEREEGATKGPKSGGSLGPPWGMIYDGWLLITMRPARIHRQISQILIQLSRLMAVGSRRRCGDLSQRGREGRGRRGDLREEEHPSRDHHYGGISVAIGTAIIPRGGGSRHERGGGGILSSGTG